jgi:hypothetical protein
MIGWTIEIRQRYDANFLTNARANTPAVSVMS